MFVDCLFDKDYKRLIIEGDATEEQLQDAWNKIHAEYATLVMNDNQTEEYELLKDVNLANAKCVLIDCIIQRLFVCYNKELVDLLNHFYLKCDLLESDDSKTIDIKLSKVLTRAKKFISELQIKQESLDKIHSSTQKETGRDYFGKALLVLSKENGYAMRANDITVYQFVTAVNMMNENIKRQIKMKPNGN